MVGTIIIIAVVIWILCGLTFMRFAYNVDHNDSIRWKKLDVAVYSFLALFGIIFLICIVVIEKKNCFKKKL